MASQEAVGGARARRVKGKNFGVEEERQLCKSVLRVSQDAITGNGQKNQAYWKRIAAHYNANRPAGGGERPARSLESKWGLIKHDVAKFCGDYQAAVALNRSGTSSEETLQKALELYKSKHPKKSSFVFMHCWLIVKDIPRWAEIGKESRRITPLKRGPSTCEAVVAESQAACKIEVLEEAACKIEVSEVIAEVATSGGGEILEQPQGNRNRAAKEDQNALTVKECSIRAQAKATADMAAATLKQAEIMEDQSALALFTIPDDQVHSDEAREYLKLRRREELEKLRRRLQPLAHPNPPPAVHRAPSPRRPDTPADPTSRPDTPAALGKHNSRHKR